MAQADGEQERGGVQAVVLTLRILEYLATQPKAVGVTALAQTLGMNKSRIYRHLRTLMQEGYVVQLTDTERYKVGARLITLGRAVSDSFDLAGAASDVIRELREALGHSCVISQPEPNGIRVISAILGKSPIEIGVKPGSLLAFHGSAQGKVALAFGDQELREAIINSQLESWTPATITSGERLRAELEKVAKQGWAVAPNEALIGLNTLAAPIFDASGALAGMIGIVDSIQFILAEPSIDQIRHTVEAAQKISRALGYLEEVQPG
jgi:DNA-binding IclR family transcriptional regulator